MTDIKQTIAKLEIIKELANASSVKQVCDVLIDHIRAGGKTTVGFESEESS